MTSPAAATARTDAPSAPAGWRWAPLWVLAFVALWPAPGIAEGVLVLGALTAVVLLLRDRFRSGGTLLSAPAWALTSVLFFAYWLPQLLASVDAVDVGRALRESAADLRYLPFLWLAAAAAADARGRRLVFGGLALIVAVWVADALIEALAPPALGGTSPLFAAMDAIKRASGGAPLCDAQDLAVLDRLGGVLGPCNLKLGIVLASLSPFALFAAAARFGRMGWLIAAGLIGIVVLLAGARAAWLTYALVLAVSGWRLLGWQRLLAVFAAGAALLAVLSVTVPKVQERIERSARALTGEDSGVDSALSGRGRIWSAALCMAGEHPINGVGPRGFRKEFPACDPQPTQAPEWGTGPALHAHQLVLEVLSETGVIGLLLWLAGAALAFRAWRYADAAAREAARPAMLALAVTVFPLNTHLAFYSTFWGGVTLLLAALYAGSLLGRGDGDAAAPERG